VPGLRPPFDFRFDLDNLPQSVFPPFPFRRQVDLGPARPPDRLRPLHQGPHLGPQLRFQPLGICPTHRFMLAGIRLHFGAVEAHVAQLQNPETLGDQQNPHKQRFQLR
jgi:hypothetical protein